MITVVSGLPRSGTSMMMRILKASGMPVSTDNTRKPDTNNPHGYFENQRVKTLHRDNSWLKEIDGKAVKIVSPLLYDLDLSCKYRIVYMNRKIDEIIESQDIMIGDQPSINDLRSKYETAERAVKIWLALNKIPFCDVNYNNMFFAPERELEKVLKFLDIKGSAKYLGKFIDPLVWRIRK